MPSHPRVTLADVARSAGVAPSIVSRLLNGDARLRIRPDTARRIRTVVAELGYRPHPVGRTLRTSRANAIGIVLPDVTNPINAEILRGAESAARAAGAGVLLGSAEELVDHEGPLRDLTGRVDGLVIQRSNAVTDEVLERLINVGIPTVLMNTDLVGHHGSIRMQDAEAVRIAVEYLNSIGHERIAHIAGAPLTDTATRRRQGWEQAMEHAGLSIDPSLLVEGGYDVEGGHLGATRLLRTRPRPTALVAANVTAALGALAALRDNGVAVPGEMSVVAIHDVWFAAHSDPSLTTVRLPLYEMASRAVEMLFRRMDGAPVETVEVDDVPPKLIVRRSTAPPRSS